MAKQLVFGEDARRSLKKGIDRLEGARRRVRAETGATGQPNRVARQQREARSLFH